MDLSAARLSVQISKLQSLDRLLTFRISRMSKLLEVEGANRLAGSGVNLTAYRMLLVIDVFGEITISDLSRIMVIDRAQISRAASELISRGYLEAKADRTSKRKKLLCLTAEGQAHFLALKERFADRQEALESLLTKDDLEALWRALDQISTYVAARVEEV